MEQPKLRLKIIQPKLPFNENWSIVEMAKNNPPDGWEDVFKESLLELEDIQGIIDGKPFYPMKRDLFKAFELTPLNKVRVVIIGQDPYPQAKKNGVPRAQGLSFSVARDDEIPSSLSNIYKELQSSIPGFIRPYHGDISRWAKEEGVLLLNMSLTVSPYAAGSEGILWMGFIKEVLNAINEKRPGTIFLLWGKEAQKVKKFLGNKVVTLETSHPSGLSAGRGFLGSGHFAKVNEILTSRGEKPIDWHID